MSTFDTFSSLFSMLILLMCFYLSKILKDSDSVFFYTNSVYYIILFDYITDALVHVVVGREGSNCVW